MRNAAITLSLFAVCLSCAPLKGPAAPVVVDQPVVRGEAAERIHRYLEGIQRFGFPGAVLVANPRGVILRNGYGPAAAGRRLSADMVFDMGSMTKQFTAAAILLLEAEGRLSTGDSLARFFPALPADKRGITLHHLLTHTSGIISDFAGDYDQVSRDSALHAIFNAPLLAPPGREFNYSNAGFSLLAMIIEQLSGQEYERFMRERIFAPIGMRHTGYVLPELDSALVAHTFTPPVDHGTPAERLARAGGPGWNLKGNGGVLTTLDDLYRYELALMQGRPITHAIQAKQFAEQFRRTPKPGAWIRLVDRGGRATTACSSTEAATDPPPACPGSIAGIPATARSSSCSRTIDTTAGAHAATSCPRYGVSIAAIRSWCPRCVPAARSWTPSSGHTQSIRRRTSSSRELVTTWH